LPVRHQLLDAVVAESIGPSSAMSAAVQTATTPGMRAASVVSRLRMRPCAKAERTTCMCNSPANEISAANVPRPGTSGGSSSRSTRSPITFAGAASGAGAGLPAGAVVSCMASA
jgi:hypothetical protein